MGFHLNIVAGRPLTSAPSITDPKTGAFYSLPQLATRAMLGSVSWDDVSAECVAQLAKLRGAGIRVSHIDSHRHVHALPGFTDAALASEDGYTWQRECEIEALTSPTLRNRLDQREIKLVNFSSLSA